MKSAVRSLEVLKSVVDKSIQTVARMREINRAHEEHKSKKIDDETFAKSIVRIHDEQIDTRKSYRSQALSLWFINYYITTYIHEKRWMDGVYKSETGAIEKRIKEIERENGLAENQFWRRGEGPEEYIKLNAEYDKIYDQAGIEAYKECLSPKTLGFLNKNWSAYERASEIGRKSIFERKRKRTIGKASIGILIKNFERESRVCAKSKAYYSACVMRGAATEALLLEMAIQNEESVIKAMEELRRKKEIRSQNLKRLTLDELLKIAKYLEWLPQYKYKERLFDLPWWAELIKDTRNAIHPGRIVDAERITMVTKSDYNTVTAVYNLLKAESASLLRRRTSKSDPGYS